MDFTVFDYYLEKNKDKNYVDLYQSTSGEKYGKPYWYINVNFRTIYAFINTFPKFVKYDNKDRSTWEVYSNKEQKAKHWSVRMQQSKLFKKHGATYALTEKGRAFGDFVKIIEDPSFLIGRDEQWIIIYLFILNAYFNKKPNYILENTQDIFDIMTRNGINVPYFLDSIKVLLRDKNIDKNELIKYDCFWLLSFFRDNDFITLFLEADEDIKEKLKSYIISELKKPSKGELASNDLIGHKYVDSGQYNVSMFIDDAKTLYVTKKVLELKPKSLMDLVKCVCSAYEDFCSINQKIVEDFISMHNDVFEIVFNEAILNKNIDTELGEDDIELTGDPEENVDLENADATTTKGTAILRKTSQILKRMAKEKSSNKCELEDLYGCKYFTSKESNNNYLEIHHLIPFEFSTDFEATLETLSNYVALCPHCHRLLHFGVDRERKPALTYLFNKRKDLLKEKGLDIKLKELLEYYGLEKEEIDAR